MSAPRGQAAPSLRIHGPQRIPGRSGCRHQQASKCTRRTLQLGSRLSSFGDLLPILPTAAPVSMPHTPGSRQGPGLGGRVVTVWPSPLHSGDGGLAGVRDSTGSLSGHQPPPPLGPQPWKLRPTQVDRRPGSGRATHARRCVRRSHPRVAKTAFAGREMPSAGDPPAAAPRRGSGQSPKTAPP